MALEEWNNVLQVSSVVLLALTFVVGTATVVVDRIISARQEARIAEAEQGTAKALADGATANERAGNLELETLKQRERAAKAEKELLELQQRLAWRSLTEDQSRDIVEKLKSFAGTGFDIRVFQDTEPLNLLNQIEDILHRAGWKQLPIVAAVEISSKHGPVGITLASGVRVQFDSRHLVELWKPANALALALNAAGLEAVAEVEETGITPERMHIFLGKKPDSPRR